MIGFIILNYRTYNDTIDLIKSIKKIKDKNKIHIFVVDNQTNQKELELLKLNISQEDLVVTYIPLDSNLGFANGMNQGIRAAKSIGCDYIVCSNNDILLPNEFTFSGLINPYVNNEKVAMIGPIIKNLSNENQNPLYLKDPFRKKIKNKIITLFFLNHIFGKSLYILRGLIKEYTNKKKKNLDINHSDIYCLHGSFFVLTPSYFHYYDELDKNTFLYFEELILAKRIDLVGLCSKLNTNSYVVHKEDSSTNDIFKQKRLSKSLFVLKENYKSFKYFFTNYIK